MVSCGGLLVFFWVYGCGFELYKWGYNLYYGGHGGVLQGSRFLFLRALGWNA